MQTNLRKDDGRCLIYAWLSNLNITNQNELHNSHSRQLCHSIPSLAILYFVSIAGTSQLRTVRIIFDDPLEERTMQFQLQ